MRYCLLLIIFLCGCTPVKNYFGYYRSPEFWNAMAYTQNSPAYQAQAQRQHEKDMAQQQRIFQAQQAIVNTPPIQTQTQRIKMTDYNCQSDCLNKGYVFQYCNSFCSY